jgi:hypothetical protein
VATTTTTTTTNTKTKKKKMNFSWGTLSFGHLTQNAGAGSGGGGKYGLPKYAFPTRYAKYAAVVDEDENEKGRDKEDDEEGVLGMKVEVKGDGKGEEGDERGQGEEIGCAWRVGEEWDGICCFGGFWTWWGTVYGWGGWGCSTNRGRGRRSE